MFYKNFFMISNSIFDLQLSPRDFTVYCCLLRHCDRKMKCFPSRRTVAKDCCIDKKTVDSAVKSLTSVGLVKKINQKCTNNTQASNIYLVTNLLYSDPSGYAQNSLP